MIVVGLGNPGPEYVRTRHNAGFLVLEAARRRWRGADWRRHSVYEQSEVRLGGGQLGLVRPLTYMNLSGQAVERLLKSGAAPADLFVILDDLDLPLGALRIRRQGGAGGHNGLQSILDAVGSTAVARLRIGVGRPPEDRAVEHVLGEFSAQEWERFEQISDRVLDAVQVIARRGIGPAMNAFNGLPAPWAEPGDGGERDPGEAAARGGREEET